VHEYSYCPLLKGAQGMNSPRSDQEASSNLHISHKILRLAYGPAASQFGELYLPRVLKSDLTVILIHGGFWRSQYGLDLMTDLARDLAIRGMAVWNIEYRRLGETGENAGGWPATLLDVARAADYLRVLAPAYGLQLQRVVSIGHSAGGHLALWLAARHCISRASILHPTYPTATGSRVSDSQGSSGALKLAGAISLAGAVYLELCWQLNLSNGVVATFLGGSPDQVPERYAAASPAALLPLGVPQVLIHGALDDIVPLQVSQVYTQRATEAGDRVTLIQHADSDHFTLIDPCSMAWASTIQALSTF
jgi:acetyl esterase/lipase